MREIDFRRTAVLGLVTVALVAPACGNSTSVDTSAAPMTLVVTSESEAPEPPAEVTLVGERDVEVTLTGAIAAKYLAATDFQRTALGKVLTGDFNAGSRDGSLQFQQFQGGVITAKNNQADAPGYITWGRIREAWNVPRDPDGMPAVTGENGSVGPLGAPTSDEYAEGDLLVQTFDHGRVVYNRETDQAEVTINGTVVPSGL